MSQALAEESGRGAQIAWWWAIGLLAIVAGVAIALFDLNALFIAASLVGCGLVLFDFRVGVALLVLLLPLSRSSIFPHAMFGVTGLNPFNLLLAGTLGSWLLHALFDAGARRFLPRPLLWLYILPIAAAAAIGMGHVGEIRPMLYIHRLVDFATPTGYLIEMFIKPMTMVLVALLLGAAVARSQRPEGFLIPVLVSIWAMGVMVVVFVIQSGLSLRVLGSAGARETLSALGLHANDLGRLYVFAYSMLLFVWVGAHGAFLRLVLLGSMGLVVVALVLTFSRGAYFGFIVVNALFLLWRVNLRTALFLVLLAGGALLLMPEAVYDRMGTGSGRGLNAVSAGRVEGIWLPLLPDVMNSPIFGNGLGSILWTKAHIFEGSTRVVGVTHPHNAYLQVLLDMGIVGVLLVGAYFFHVWKGLRALAKDETLSPELSGFFQGALAGLLSYLISAVSDSRFTPVPEQGFLWVAIGLMYGMHARKAGRDDKP
jgi:O-antigen ligase